MPSRGAPGPRLTVITPALSPSLMPIALQVRMSENEHQIATLTVLTPLARDRQVLDASVPASLVLPEGTAVCISFGSTSTDTALWYGYVASRQVQSTKAQHGNTQIPVVPVVYTCTGISMPMQSARSRAYTGITASAAARRVIADYGIAAYITPHPRIWPALAQGTASDFVWLTQLAAMIGYRLIVDTNRISFAPAVTDLTPATVTAPVFTRSLQPGIWDSLISFDPASGQTDPSGAVVTSLASYAVRPTSGTPATATLAPPIIAGNGTPGAPTFTKIATGTAQSLSDAGYNAAAGAAAARYWVYASAKVDGISVLRPGRTVQLAGLGVTAADQGRWRTGVVTHEVILSPLGRGTSTYHADLELGRDQYAGLDVRPPRPALAPAAAMSLVGGAWISPGAGGGT